jgi:hypothetical protein
MADVINEYQRWKEQGENLRSQAKQAMESRFRELLSEAVAIAEEYRADFGAPLKPPTAVTAFRYKASGKPKPKKAAKAPAKEPAPKAAATKNPEPAAASADPKAEKLRKRLEAARKKLADAKAAGTPTRALEDRVYEIEDALRLAGEPA